MRTNDTKPTAMALVGRLRAMRAELQPATCRVVLTPGQLAYLDMVCEMLGVVADRICNTQQREEFGVPETMPATPRVVICGCSSKVRGIRGKGYFAVEFSGGGRVWQGPVQTARDAAVSDAYDRAAVSGAEVVIGSKRVSKKE